MRTKHKLLLFACCIGATCALALQAQMPRTIVLQGQLFLANGQPVPDGDVPVTVTLHAGATTDDVIPICNPCTVSFKQGVFTMVLGTDDQSPLPPMDKQYWVELAVNGEALQPRLALQSVPYALNAEHANNTPGSVPIGAIMPFAGPTTAIPEGWMLCDGRAMSSKATPKLYEACATLWGDGSNDSVADTDFNLPDLRGMFLRGAEGGGRDQYAHARSHYPGPPAVSPDSAVGKYAATVDGFEGRPFKLRESPSKPSIKREIESTVALRTPNAAVNYIIRVR